MSNFTKGRVTRKHIPKQVILRGRHRDAWPYLDLDFQGRCAYSMQHTYRAGGKKCMEVDHFNPNKKKDGIQQYSNLFLSTRHCNGAKRDRWPTNKDRQLGIRFLNCCEEHDYGVHIFEDPDTHELVGVTSEGKYHIRNCDLNAPHLIAERQERARLQKILTRQRFRVKSANTLVFDEVTKAIEALRGVVERMIPTIPYLSGKDLEERRARRRRLGIA